MQLEKNNGSNKIFISVLADGKFHQSVPDGTEGSIVREYEDKEGNKKTKTELVFDSVSGKITNLSFEEGDFGKSLWVEFDNDGILSLSTNSNFGEDLMKKLPAVDFEKEVKLVPFSFDDDKGKNRKGITVYQDDNKVESFYYDREAKKVINNMPEAEEGLDYKSEDGKIYFMQVRKFLIGEIEKLADKLKIKF